MVFELVQCMRYLWRGSSREIFLKFSLKSAMQEVV